MRVFELLIVLLPVLAVYSSPIKGLDFGTFCSLLVFIFTVRRVRIYKERAFWLLLGYITIVTSFNLMFTDNRFSESSSIIMRTLRFLFMMIMYVGISRDEDFNRSSFLRNLRRMTLFVCLYAILQQIVFRFTGQKLINVIAPTKQGYIFNSALGLYETTYRPPSIFLEPSGVTYYVIPFLCFCLFGENYEYYIGKNTNFFDAIIITLGLIATTSGQGIAILGIVWLIWIFLKLRSRSINGFISAIPIVVAGIIALTSSTIVQYTIDRIFTNSGMSAIDARSTGYVSLSLLNEIQRIFGVGYGNYLETVYYTSLADILFCLGYVGLIINIVLFSKLYIKGCVFQRVLVIATCVLMLSGGIYTATYLCYYFPLIIYFFPGNDTKLEY